MNKFDIKIRITIIISIIVFLVIVVVGIFLKEYYGDEFKIEKSSETIINGLKNDAINDSIEKHEIISIHIARSSKK